MKPALTLILLALASIAYPQSTPNTVENELTSKYRDRILVLRGFYRTESLHFGAGGKLISRGDSGYGPTDGSLHAASFSLSNNQLTIKGDLPVPIYDAKSGKLIYTRGLVERVVVLDVEDATKTSSVEAALWTVFYQPGEHPLPTCSPERRAAFREEALKVLEHKSSPLPKNLLDKPLPIFCFPNGESAPHIRIGASGPITPPKVIDSPTPSYSKAAREKHVEGEVKLSIIVDSFGRPSTIVVLRPLGNGLDESAAKNVYSWRFEPAKRDGSPTPVAMGVEISFHLY